MNKDWEKGEDYGKSILSEFEKENLDLLSDELIKVFDYENVDKSSRSQKKDLIQWFLKIGGDQYTYEDLRRDLVSFEKGDKNRKSPLKIEYKVTTARVEGFDDNSSKISQ